MYHRAIYSIILDGRFSSVWRKSVIAFAPYSAAQVINAFSLVKQGWHGPKCVRADLSRTLTTFHPIIATAIPLRVSLDEPSEEEGCAASRYFLYVHVVSVGRADSK